MVTSWKQREFLKRNNSQITLKIKACEVKGKCRKKNEITEGRKQTFIRSIILAFTRDVRTVGLGSSIHTIKSYKKSVEHLQKGRSRKQNKQTKETRTFGSCTLKYIYKHLRKGTHWQLSIQAGLIRGDM